MKKEYKEAGATIVEEFTLAEDQGSIFLSTLSKPGMEMVFIDRKGTKAFVGFKPKVSKQIGDLTIKLNEME